MQRIADLTGATFAHDGPNAAPTVTFAPAPSTPTLAREPVAAAEAPPSSAATSSAPTTRAENGIDLDEVYEHVAARLRRELLHDRERIGDLLGDLQPIGPPR